eukprot:8663-Heterococcus_DN1.PRE.1
MKLSVIVLAAIMATSSAITASLSNQLASEPNADEVDMPSADGQHRELACTLGTYTGCSTGGAAGKILQPSSLHAEYFMSKQMQHSCSHLSIQLQGLTAQIVAKMKANGISFKQMSSTRVACSGACSP